MMEALGVSSLDRQTDKYQPNDLHRCNIMAFRLPVALRLAGVRFMSSGEFGSGAGKGGGTGGAVRDAGGAFGKMEAAHEEMYFKKLTAMQLERIRDHLEEEVDHHQKAIREHEEAIERHKKKIQKLHNQEKDIDSD